MQTTEQVLTKIQGGIGTTYLYIHLTTERLFAIRYKPENNNYGAAAAGGVLGVTIYNIFKSTKNKDIQPTHDLTIDEMLKTCDKNFAIYNKDILAITYDRGRINNKLIIKKTDKEIELSVHGDQMMKCIDVFKQVYGDRFVYKTWNQKK